MNFNDRFGAAYRGQQPPIPPLVPPGPSMVPGVTLGSTPFPPPAQMRPPVGPGVQPLEPPGGTTVIQPPPGAGGPTDPNAPPFRLDRPGTAVGAPPPALPPDTSPAAMPTTPPPPRPPMAFPAQAEPVPYSKPAIEQQGTTLTSGGPQAPGWAGSVGLPTTPAEASAFAKGGNYEKLMGGLDEINKGIKGKESKDPTMNQIIPSNLQPNASNQLSAELLNTMLMGKQRQRGLTLTGR